MPFRWFAYDLKLVFHGFPRPDRDGRRSFAFGFGDHSDSLFMHDDNAERLDFCWKLESASGVRFDGRHFCRSDFSMFDVHSLCRKIDVGIGKRLIVETKHNAGERWGFGEFEVVSDFASIGCVRSENS